MELFCESLWLIRPRGRGGNKRKKCYSLRKKHLNKMKQIETSCNSIKYLKLCSFLSLKLWCWFILAKLHNIFSVLTISPIILKKNITVSNVCIYCFIIYQ